MQMFLSRYASHEHIFNWRMAGGGGLWRREIYTHFVWNANCLTITDAEKAFDVEKEFLAIFGCSAAQKTVFRRKIEINVYVVAFYLFRPRPIAMRHFFPFGNKFRHVFVHAWWNHRFLKRFYGRRWRVNKRERELTDKSFTIICFPASFRCGSHGR